MLGLTLAACLQASLAVTGANYKEAYKQTAETGQPLVVLVGADWCPACQTMKNSVIPQLQKSGEFKQVSFATVNTDHDHELATKLMQGGSIPQLIVFNKTDKGWERQQLTGAQSVSSTQGLLRRMFGRITGRN
jgi:thiol-disulfide isomerase/thioredoxin